MQTLLRSTWLSRTLRRSRPRFTFLESDGLREGELELIAPSEHWLDAMMATVEHPSTKIHAADLGAVTRRQFKSFLTACPGGRQSGDAAAGVFPEYHFWMFNHDRPDLPLAGAVGLRVGEGKDLELYYGHFGYHVYPAHRGRHFAERAVRLLLPLARRHGLNPLWITCNPDNHSSRRTCQRLGAALVGTVAVPAGHALRARGETAKCRYRMDAVENVHRRWPS